MPLINESQIAGLNIGKITGMLKKVTQSFVAGQGQSAFKMTVLDQSPRIIKATIMEINGVLYHEKTLDNPHGCFTRSNTYDFLWTFTAEQGGFDLKENMLVTLGLLYLTDETTVDLMMKTIKVPEQIRKKKMVIGTFFTDPDHYFEQFQLDSLVIKEFYGLVINGVMYSHNNRVSYDPEKKLLTLAGLETSDTDRLNIVYNAISQ